MLTSTHWPTGAAFFERIHRFTRTLADTAVSPIVPQQAAQVQALWMVEQGKVVGRVHKVTMTEHLEPMSSHQLLTLRQERAALETACATFLSEASALPGPRAFGLLPLLSYATLDSTSPYHATGFGTLGLHATYPSAFARTARITETATFSVLAQRVLDAVDTLCTLIPHPNAPIWTLKAPGHATSGPTVRLAFRANNDHEAAIIAPLLVGPIPSLEGCTLRPACPTDPLPPLLGALAFPT